MAECLREVISDYKLKTTDMGFLSSVVFLKYLSFQTPTKGWGFHHSVYYIVQTIKSGSLDITDKLL